MIEKNKWSELIKDVLVAMQIDGTLPKNMNSIESKVFDTIIECAISEGKNLAFTEVIEKLKSGTNND